ncbi:Sterol desaturase/sphingolipid hydroxylase, fatty acid hydroxylase superfamily [Fontimonas thermophila]|uniref:Sterol desaturase/sphingolipid hydroxylase, fatty acid hydroxylase superfamily n=1 Tax=Fontimonas thermophila TaxID=1076937 RepID=A0A1I2H857_9GAMM|nr:sterol desaturase family protein [Fontimonas thermophila]SFF25553.1 Sterol desaturase/sphingolipid hydroxylase, fatty acid hydroxylase superfamily [Fontimonas thermophila]
MLEPQALLRVMIFVGVLAVLLVGERIAPRRRDPSPPQRYLANLGLVVLDSLLLRLVLGAGALGVALAAEQRGFGLFHWIEAPGWVAGLLSLLILDLLIYFQHRAFHAVPLLWRLHRVHHSDLAFDATTALRFHPLEILLSMLIKMGAVALLGAPAWAVVAFEVLLNATAMFNHANLAVPPRLDRMLRRVLVTPDMHRVHHSIHRDETDANFGFNLPWWDRLFRTYRAQPREGHEGMTIGIERFREQKAQSLWRLLLQPLA